MFVERRPDCQDEGGGRCGESLCRSAGTAQAVQNGIVGLLAEAEQIELRWHLAQMIPRLPLAQPERRRAADTLQLYLEDRSSIVRTFALQALADISRSDAELRPRVREILEQSVVRGTAAMKARARKLLREQKS